MITREYHMEIRVTYEGALRIMPFTAKAVSEENAADKAITAAIDFYSVPASAISVLHKGTFG